MATPLPIRRMLGNLAARVGSDQHLVGPLLHPGPGEPGNDLDAHVVVGQRPPPRPHARPLRDKQPVVGLVGGAGEPGADEAGAIAEHPQGSAGRVQQGRTLRRRNPEPEDGEHAAEPTACQDWPVRLGVDVGGTFTDLVAVDDGQDRHSQGAVGAGRPVGRGAVPPWMPPASTRPPCAGSRTARPSRRTPCWSAVGPEPRW